MRTIRVYSSQKLANKKSHVFDGVEFHHIKNVLKAKEKQKSSHKQRKEIGQD